MTSLNQIVQLGRPRVCKTRNSVLDFDLRMTAIVLRGHILCCNLRSNNAIIETCWRLNSLEENVTINIVQPMHDIDCNVTSVFVV